MVKTLFAPPTYLCDLHGRITDSLTQNFLQLILVDMGRQIVNAQPGGRHKYVDVFQLFSLHLLNLVDNIPEKSHLQPHSCLVNLTHNVNLYEQGMKWQMLYPKHKKIH